MKSAITISTFLLATDALIATFPGIGARANPKIVPIPVQANIVPSTGNANTRPSSKRPRPRDITPLQATAINSPFINQEPNQKNPLSTRRARAQTSFAFLEKIMHQMFDRDSKQYHSEFLQSALDTLPDPKDKANLVFKLSKDIANDLANSSRYSNV
jgi:hypothetical protein